MYKNPKDLIIIGLDTDDGKEHPLYDERINRKLEKPFLENIRHYGVINPVIVTTKYEVVDGRQRVRAAREVGHEVEVIKVADADALMGISLNEMRSDDDPITRAEKAARLLECNNTKDVARAFGLSQKQVKNYAKIAGLCDKVKKAVKAGKLSATAAMNLAGLDEDKQVEKMNELLRSPGKPTVAKAQRTKKGKAATNGKILGGRGMRKLVKAIDRIYWEHDKPLEEDVEQAFKSVEADREFWMGAYWAMGQLGKGPGLDSAEVKGIDDLIKALKK